MREREGWRGSRTEGENRNERERHIIQGLSQICKIILSEKL